MKIRCWLLLKVALSMVLASFWAVEKTWAEVPVPSAWQGQITGQVHNTPFRLQVSIEIKSPLPFESNPVHIFVGAGNPSDIGHLFLASATQLNTYRGTATLQYLSLSLQGDKLSAVLTDTHSAEAAKANGFSGPNVSAAEASDLMRDVLQNAWGPTEMFGFDRGATLSINFQGNTLSGSIQGAGGSYTGTSSQVHYRAEMTAARIK
jgi:hypothetical protein